MERAIAIGAALSLCAAGLGIGSEPPGLAPVVLDNGVRLVLLPSKGGARVGMEAVYSVGFIDESEGMTQSAHLVEHLVCKAGTKASKPGEHWEWLSAGGVVNAETLGDFTHFDYEAPAAELPRLLEIERERLESLQITAEVVAQEVPSVYSETDQVESNPVAPLFKHAMMAANQSWRYGAPRALVRGGLLELPLERLKEFHSATYRPERLTLVISGGFERARAIELAKASVGAVKAGGAAKPRVAIDWTKVAPTARVTWDAKVSAVVLAYPPPQAARDRLAVSVLGDVLYARLSTDPQITGVARFVICTNQSWPAGDLPVFLYATVKEGVAPEECASVLKARAALLAAVAPSAMDMAQLTGLPAMVGAFEAPTWEQARAQGERLKALRAGIAGDPAGLVLLNTALRGAMLDRLVGGDPAPLRALGRSSAEELAAILTRALDPERCKVVVLEPDKAGK